MKRLITLLATLAMLMLAAPATADIGSGPHPGYALYIPQNNTNHWVCQPGQNAYTSVGLTVNVPADLVHIRVNFDSGYGTDVYKYHSSHIPFPMAPGGTRQIIGWTSPTNKVNVKAFHFWADIEGITLGETPRYTEKCFGSPIIY